MSEVDDRREEIVRLVSESGSVSVAHLAELLEVSSMTVRRDLAALDESGSLRRERGGARLTGERGYDEKHVANAEEKQAIAKTCAAMVKARDAIFLDAGTTTFEIARRILDVPGLFVVTDDIKIAFLLSQCADMDVMVCGGQVQRQTGCIIGTFADQMVSYVQIDKAFLGAASINAQFNVLTPTIEKASLKRRVVASAEESYLAVDQSKFNRKALMKTNSLGDYTAVVTTMRFSPEERRLLARRGATVIEVSL